MIQHLRPWQLWKSGGGYTTSFLDGIDHNADINSNGIEADSLSDGELGGHSKSLSDGSGHHTAALSGSGDEMYD